jgi:CRP-like cAMP-binding protein/membrane protein YdbS with pleckstrin-like domain
MAMEERTRLLKGTYLFGDLTDEDLQLVVGLLKRRSDRPRGTVYRQGDPDTNFYLVVSGRLKVWTRDERGHQRTLNYLRAGDSFGAHSLLSGERRDVSVDVEEPTELLYLEKADFDTLLASHPHLRENLSLHALQRLREAPLFGRLPLEDLKLIADSTGQTSYRQGTVIYHQGELSTTFYVIASGRVALSTKSGDVESQVITHLGPGDFFGERSLLTGRPRETSVQAVEDTKVLYLNKRDFDRLLGALPSVKTALTLEAKARELMLIRRFPWQREGEILLALARKHPYALVRSLWILVFPLIGLAAVLALARVFDWHGLWVYLMCAVATMCAAALTLWLWADWRNDYYVITSKRVVHMEKTILLRESQDEAPLESIQDISILMPSIVGRLLGFDDLSIQTAGAKGRVTFSTVGQATWMRDKLFQQLDLLRTEEKAQQKDAIRHRLQMQLGPPEVESLVAADSEPLSPREAAPTPQTVNDKRRSMRAALSALRGYLIPHMRIERDGVVTWRKHWFRLIDKTAGSAILLVVLAQLALAARTGLLSPPANLRDVFWTVFLLGVAVGLFLIWYRYEDWRNDIYQLTDERIIDVERLPLGLREERREASLSMIQDIGYEIPGPIANLLDYGNVVIETASREAVFTFSWVHQPRRVQEEVFARMDAYREREKQGQRERRTDELLDWFGTYADLSREHDPPANDRGE